MAAGDGGASARFKVEVAQDRMKAFIRLKSGTDAGPVEMDGVLTVVRSAGVVVTEDVRARCKAFIDALADPAARAQRFVIAEGRPMVAGRDGQFTWHESLTKKGREWFDGEQVDYHSFNSIVTVEKDAVLGSITHPVPGQDGLDVCGHVLKPARPPDEVRLDPSARRSRDDSNVVLANVTGRAVFENGFVAVREGVEVPGDVDFECGNIDSAVDVSIKGTVLDSFEVKSQKTITVNGAIQAAVVDAGSDVVVRGGILGRHRGKVRAGRDVVAKYIEDAEVKAKGDIKVSRGIMGGRVEALGRLISPRGTIVGGDAYGRESIEVAALGSDACVPTTIAVGIHPDAIRRADAMDEEMKARRQTIDRIRATVQPLLKDLKRLTPSQKERATELMFQADSMETEIGEAEKRRDAMLEEAKARTAPFVSVTKAIHSRVQIRIGRRRVAFDQPLPGPVRIEQRKINGVTEFVSVNQLSGSVTVLPSIDIVDPVPPKAGRAPAEACAS